MCEKLTQELKVQFIIFHEENFFAAAAAADVEALKRNGKVLITKKFQQLQTFNFFSAPDVLIFLYHRY